MMQQSSVLAFLYGDEKYREFYNFFNAVKKQISPVLVENELEQKIEKRKTLHIPATLASEDYMELKDTVISASLEGQVLRSRLTAIKIDCYKNLKKIDDYRENIQKYLFVTYKDELDKLGYKTQADKGYIINCLFIEVNRFLESLKTLDETVEFLIKDIDQQSWTLKNIISVLELVVKSGKIL
jgi:hypothetical protein